MDEKTLRRQCRKLLRDLDVRPPLNVAELCDKIGDMRGKPIRLVPRPIPVPGPFGAWITSGKADYIFYQLETSKPPQDHIILHELGHMLAGHRPDTDGGILLGDSYPDTTPAALREQYPDLAEDAVRRALRRTCYDTQQEKEAETVATIILEWASVLNAVAARSAPNSAAYRIESDLSDRLGWL